MIEEIKKIIVNNKKNLSRADFSLSDVAVAKFFHGNPAANTKVLFFVSVCGAPSCIIKIARSPEYNLLITNEIKGLAHFKENNLRAPHVFFHGELHGLLYVCEEILDGVPLGKSSEVDVLPFLITYNASVKKNKKIKIGSILDLFTSIQSKYGEFVQTVELLKGRMNEEVWLAPQHGDVTYKNLIQVGEQVYFIDFENFNVRPIWGLDLVHYLTRITNAYSKERDVSETLRLFVESIRKNPSYATGIEERELENIFLLDLFFEILQKNFFKRHVEILPLMEKIWSL